MRCEDCRCWDCECDDPKQPRDIKGRFQVVVERAKVLREKLTSGDCDTDDLIRFVEEVSWEEV